MQELAAYNNISLSKVPRIGQNLKIPPSGYGNKNTCLTEEKRIAAENITTEKRILKNNHVSSLVEAENHFYASQGYMVGKFIAENIHNPKVLIVGDEDFEKGKRGQAFIAALKKGMGNNNAKAVALSLISPPKRSESMLKMSLMETMTSKDFDATISANSAQNVIVSTIGLPRDAYRMKLWRMPASTRPKLILIGGGGGSIKLAPAIERGMISAVVAISLNAKFDSETPSTFEDAFKKRYILIDKTNVNVNKKSL
jgi:hypothetical protein